MAPGGEAIIRYRINTRKLGSVNQTVTVSADRKDGKATKTNSQLKSYVVSKSDLNSK